MACALESLHTLTDALPTDAFETMRTMEDALPPIAVPTVHVEVVQNPETGVQSVWADTKNPMKYPVGYIEKCATSLMALMQKIPVAEDECIFDVADIPLEKPTTPAEYAERMHRVVQFIDAPFRFQIIEHLLASGHLQFLRQTLLEIAQNCTLLQLVVDSGLPLQHGCPLDIAILRTSRTYGRMMTAWYNGLYAYQGARTNSWVMQFTNIILACNEMHMEIPRSV